MPSWNFLQQRQLKNFAVFQSLLGEILRKKTKPEIPDHSWEDQVRGFHLDIRIQRKVVLVEKLLIEESGPRPFSEKDQRVFVKLPQGQSLVFQILILESAN